jgi:acyl-CoA thioesterase
MSSDAEAAAIIAAITARNTVAHNLGVGLVEGRAGYASLAMTVLDKMVGGHGVCQGGYIFTLADMAGAYACLSRDVQCLTQTANITYISPAQRGERLVAAAVEMSRTRRSATYDVRITAGDRLVALFRGQWRLLEGSPLAARGITP